MTIDKLTYGIVLGIVLPLLTMYGFFSYGVSQGTSWAEFFQWLIKINYAASLIAVSVLSNLAAFMGLAYSNKMRIARGIFMSTMLWVVVVVVFKYIIQE